MLPPRHFPHPPRHEDHRRAVFLSILCALGLFLLLALLAWLFAPRAQPPAIASASPPPDISGQGVGGSAAGHGKKGDEGSGAGSSGAGTGRTETTGTGPGQSDGDASSDGSDKGPGTGGTATAGAALGPPEKDPAKHPGPSKNPPATTPGAARPGPSGEEQTTLAMTEVKLKEKPAPGPAGTSAAPAFFGARGSGTSFVYIVDRSGSMTGDRFEAARAGLKKSLRTLRANMTFQIFFYDSAFEAFQAGKLLPATPGNVAAAITWIDQQVPRGGTEPAVALTQALLLQPHTIWLLTDGQFSDDVCARIDQENPGRRTSINTIAFHDPSAEALLRRIARENRGDYTFVPPSGLSPGSANGALTPKTDSEWEKLFGHKKTP